MAEPPPGADEALAPWYRSLSQPATGYLCCSLADCRNVVTRDHEGRLQAFISRTDFRDGVDDWVDVPDAVTLHGLNNPTGAPVLCWLNGAVRCFVDGPAT
jgi:hypothetical protein